MLFLTILFSAAAMCADLFDVLRLSVFITEFSRSIAMFGVLRPCLLSLIEFTFRMSLTLPESMSARVWCSSFFPPLTHVTHVVILASFSQQGVIAKCYCLFLAFLGHSNDFCRFYENKVQRENRPARVYLTGVAQSPTAISKCGEKKRRDGKTYEELRLLIKDTKRFFQALRLRNLCYDITKLKNMFHKTPPYSLTLKRK